MLPEDWSRALSASVVPVVIISACGLLCLAFYNRLASIVNRLRGFQRERLAEQEEYARRLFAGETDKVMLIRHHRVLAMLEEQTRGVIRRARLIRRTLLCLLGTIACLTICSLAAGLSVQWPAAMYASAAAFLAAMALLLVGITHAIIEMLEALHPVELESDFVSRLSLEFEHLIGEDEDNS